MNVVAFAGTAIGANDFIGIIIAVAPAGYLVYILIRHGRVGCRSQSWLEIVFFFALLAISTPLLGTYMARVHSNEKARPASPPITAPRRTRCLRATGPSTGCRCAGTGG